MSSPSRSGTAALTAIGLVVCGAVAVAVAVGLSTLNLGREAVVVALAVVMGGGFAFVAATRFALFLTVLLVVRASLDGFKLSGFGSSAISEPGVTVGGVLLLGCLLWLLAQREAGTLAPLSRSARWISAFAGAAILSAVGSADPVASLQAGIRITAGALSFVVMEQLLVQRPELIRRLLVAGGLSLIVPALVGLRQVVAPDELYAFTDVSRIDGTFVHPNSFGAYLAIVAVVAVAMVPATSGKGRIFAAGIGGLALILLLFTYARGAWIAAVFGIGYIVIRHKRELIPALVMAGLVVVALVPSVGSRLGDLESSPAPTAGSGTSNSLEWRFGYWEKILPMAAEQPVTGIGLDRVPQRTSDGAEPHNGFVQALVETGVLGLTMLIGLVVAVWRDLAEARRTAANRFDRAVAIGASAAAGGILAQMFTENLLTQVAIHLYLWIPLAYGSSRLVAARVGGYRRDGTGRAGLPTTTAPDSTSWTTTAPAPTVAPSPM